MKKKTIKKGVGDGYQRLVTDISDIITHGRGRTIQAIDVIQAQTHWRIGRVIVEYEQGGRTRAEYGDALIARLSVDMIARFGKGFSETNLKMMRLFYQSFPIRQSVSDKSMKNKVRAIRQTVSDEFNPKLSWSNYCELLKEDNLNARAFYEIEAIENGWSMRELRWQMDSKGMALIEDEKYS